LSLQINSWKPLLWPQLRQLLQAEQRIVFIGVLICALFAVVRPDAPLTFMGVCVLVIGNLMFALQFFGSRIYYGRTFPWNWVLYLPVLAAGAGISAFAAVGLLHWMRPASGDYWHLFHESWRIIMVVCMGTGIAAYSVVQIQEKLQAKNKLLEQAVERGNLALHQQEQELGRALEIQKDLLPKELPQLPGIELAGAWRPARTVGGDYFDVIVLDENRLGVCVGDVSGKGLTASLLMANLQAAFRAYATVQAPPAEVCAKLNAFMCGNVAPGKFITFFYAILDAKTRTMTYENAGHCPAVLLHAGSHLQLLCGQGGVLGVQPEWTYRDSTVRLSAGDRLLIFTDGVTEAENGDAIEFGTERIIESAGPRSISASETKRLVLDGVTRFCDGDFHDDVTLLVAAVS
jgi:phosphoserine phosphatase RsbU/P